MLRGRGAPRIFAGLAEITCGENGPTGILRYDADEFGLPTNLRLRWAFGPLKHCSQLLPLFLTPRAMRGHRLLQCPAGLRQHVRDLLGNLHSCISLANSIAREWKRKG